jgi:hypothetical protein
MKVMPASGNEVTAAIVKIASAEAWLVPIALPHC